MCCYFYIIKLTQDSKEYKPYKDNYNIMLDHYDFSKKECNQIISFGRNALDTYTIENQRMDVGSVDDLLNMKGGVLLLAESTKGMNRTRGNACVTEGQRIADSIIDAMIQCASSRSIGSEIRKSETNDILFKMAVIEEVIITDDPLETLQLGTDSYYINKDNESGWIYPTKPIEYGWDKKEFLSRTCKKSELDPNYWNDNECIILRTKPCYEKNPNGEIKFTEESG